MLRLDRHVFLVYNFRMHRADFDRLSEKAPAVTDGHLSNVNSVPALKVRTASRSPAN